MVCLLVVGVPKGYPTLVCIGEVRFLEITIDKVRVTKKACAKIGVVEVTITEIAMKRIDADEVCMGDGGTAEVAVEHLAA
jgi:hypothetical protein